MTRGINLENQQPRLGRQAGWYSSPDQAGACANLGLLESRREIAMLQTGHEHAYQVGKKEGYGEAGRQARTDLLTMHEKFLETVGLIVDRGTGESADPVGALNELQEQHRNMLAMHDAERDVQERINDGQEIPDHELHQFMGNVTAGSEVEQSVPAPIIEQSTRIQGYMLG